MIKKITFMKKKDVIYRIIDAQAVILTFRDSRLHTLNEVGTFIWEHLDGKKSVGDLITGVHGTFDVELKKADRDVTSFVENLMRYKLISVRKRSD